VYWIFIRQWQPPLSLFTVAYPGPAPALGMLAWAVLAHFLWTRIRAAWQPPTGVRAGSPS